MKKKSSPPERTCVVCRAKRPKRALARVTKVAGSPLAIDTSGRGPGRGAYVCTTRACLLEPTLVRRLEHALRLRLEVVDRRMLETWVGEAAPVDDDPAAGAAGAPPSVQ